MDKNACIKKIRNIACASDLKAGVDRGISVEKKDWQSEDGQKDRSYFRLIEYNYNTKGRIIKEYGYYDNINNIYVPGDNDLTKDLDFYDEKFDNKRFVSKKWKEDPLEYRMAAYEVSSQNVFKQKHPIIVRVNVKTINTLTKNFKKFLDLIFMNCMQKTMEYLCNNVQGCTFGYTQSDEISLLLCDYQVLNKNVWANYNIQHIISDVVSKATFYFNRVFAQECNNYFYNEKGSILREDYSSSLRKTYRKGIFFDAKTFTLPEEEIKNYFIWRQQGAIEKSAHTVAQRGCCCIIKERISEHKNWVIDKNIPLFSEDEDYIYDKAF